MSYSTQQNLIDAFGSAELIQLTDRGNTGLIDTTVLVQAQTWADALINSKISTRLTLPLATPYPQRLIDIACDLTRYRLYKDQAPEHIRTAYDDAIKQLDAVRDGKESLGLTSGGQVVSTPSLAETSSSPSVFSRGVF